MRARPRHTSWKRSASPHSEASATSRKPAPSTAPRSAAACSASIPPLGPPSAAQLVALLHPDDQERIRGLAQRAFDDGANADTEFRVVHDSGHVLWLHALLETFTGPGGEVILLRGTLRDITREKHAEDERDAAIARLNTALFGSSLILVDVDTSGPRVPVGALERASGWRGAADAHRLRVAHGAHARGRARGDTAGIRRGDHGPQARLQPRAPGTRAGRLVEVGALPRARVPARREWTRPAPGGHQRGHHRAQGSRGAAAPQRIALPQPAGAVVRLVLGAGRRPALHRGVGHGSGSRLAGHRAVARRQRHDPGADSASRSRPRPLSLARRPRASPSAISRSPSATATANGATSLLGRAGVRCRRHVHRLSRHRARRDAIAARRGAHPRASRTSTSSPGLPNRTMFMHTLQRAFALAQRHGKQFVLFFIDLDRFKNINDSLGHEAGDRLLQEVARRLRHHLRESDTVARLGGDEFVVLVEDCAWRCARSPRSRRTSWPRSAGPTCCRSASST